jgi:hypothetical protein
MQPVFISYRRDDTEGQAGRLFESLREAFGEHMVFMDVETIEPGADFRRAIESNIEKCSVLLSLIGRTWLTVTDKQGQRRLDDPNDFVRLETSSALKRGVRVIPVLVQGATMPREADLPADIKELAYRNSVELTHARWDSDVQLLINALRGLGAAAPTATAPSTAAPSIASPPPVGTVAHSSNDSPGKSAARIWVMGGAVAAIALTGAVLLKVTGTSRDAGSTPSTQQHAALPSTLGPASVPVPVSVSTPAATAGDQPAREGDQVVSKKELQRRAHMRGACVKPFIWREAQPGDKVCVTPDTQTRILAENRAAADNRSPTGGTYGPNTCKSGFVWREAFDGDTVCVTPESRQLTAVDNAYALQRIVPLP